MCVCVRGLGRKGVGDGGCTGEKNTLHGFHSAIVFKGTGDARPALLQMHIDSGGCRSFTSDGSLRARRMCEVLGVLSVGKCTEDIFVSMRGWVEPQER